MFEAEKVLLLLVISLTAYVVTVVNLPRPQETFALAMGRWTRLDTTYSCIVVVGYCDSNTDRSLVSTCIVSEIVIE